MTVEVCVVQEKSSVMFNPMNLKQVTLHSYSTYEHRTQINFPCLPKIHHNLVCLLGVKDEIIVGAPCSHHTHHCS